MTRSTRRTGVVVAATMLVALLLATAGVPAGAAPGDFTLTILHNNDAESQLIDAGSGLEDFGGVARFKTVVDNLRAAAFTDGVMLISSGDNFLAGPEFNLSLDKGVPFYDSIALDALGYDAFALGNHDFDFGPDVLADFIAGFTATDPPNWLSANLSFDAEPKLKALVDTGVIVSGQEYSVAGESVGVIGLTTPNLPLISSPRDVVVDDDLAGSVQGVADAMTGLGIDKIILTSHLQDISNEIELAEMLTDVDVIIAGGGDELLANAGDLLIPGDVADPAMPYPMLATDKAGKTVPVVTTTGEYQYVGKLEVIFDASGDVSSWSGGPVRVSGTGADAVAEDPGVKAAVTDPVVAGLAALSADIVATSEVDLDGRRDSVRSMETNAGDLIADALLAKATELASSFGLKEPDVALQNGGGIRNNSIIPAGDLSVLDTFDMVPFPNFVTVLEDIPHTQFKEVMENAVACTQPDDFTTNPNCGSGRFAQIAGFEMVWEPAGTAQILDDMGNVVVPGTRVRSIELADGTDIYVDGQPTGSARPVTVVTVDFLARGGDQYPFRGHPFTTVGTTYQKALQDYLEDKGTVTAAEYPEGGSGRITLAPDRGTIKIVKDAVPDDPADFSFTGTLGSFSLDDDADATLSDTATFSGLVPGAFSVTEAALAGWATTDASCDDANSTGSAATRTATIALDPGETVTCTFTNRQLPTANPDSYTTPYATLLEASSVLGNDTDPAGEFMFAIKDSDPAVGQLDFFTSGEFRYTPPAGFSGDVTFTYHVEVGPVSSAPAQVTITVAEPTGSVDGTVFLDGAPLVDVEVWLAEGFGTGGQVNRYACTDGDGQFSFSGIAVGVPLVAATGPSVAAGCGNGEFRDPATGAQLKTQFHDHRHVLSMADTFVLANPVSRTTRTLRFDILYEGDNLGMVDTSAGLWHLRAPFGQWEQTFYYGDPGDVPFMGDWDCDGVATPGLFRPSDAFAYLRNSNTVGIADIRFFFGNPSDVPVAGDFNGDGCDTLSLYRPTEQRFYIINELGEDEGGLGDADYTFAFGNQGDTPFVGDFDGDGIDEVGLHRATTGLVYFENTLIPNGGGGAADVQFIFGDPGDRFVAGDWIAAGFDAPGLFRPSDATWYLKFANTPGAADATIAYGEPPWLPVAGYWGLQRAAP